MSKRPRKKSGRGTLTLFWCRTQDGSNDWFVVAYDADHARYFFAREMGYEARDVQTNLVAGLRGVWQEASAKWPSLELIASVGEAFLNGDGVGSTTSLGRWSIDSPLGRGWAGVMEEAIPPRSRRARSSSSCSLAGAIRRRQRGTRPPSHHRSH